MSQSSNFLSLGKYDLLEKVGEGGFGIVYRAQDPLLDRQVAVKVLRSDLASSPEFIERFRREARLAASLRHPNIVTVIEVGSEAGRYFLVMDYLSGGSLSQRLKAGEPMSLAETIAILRPISEALDFAHKRTIIHRDIKPANIMFDAEGQPVLMDFGLVKNISETGLTTTGQVLGSVEYMAPEQIQGESLSPAADLYALGVVAYQMLTGQTPFSGKSPFDVQKKHVHHPAPDPRQFNPGLPPEACAVLERALAKDPSSRYSNARSMIQELAEIQQRYARLQAETLLKEAQGAMSDQDFDLAISHLEQVQALHPTDDTQSLLGEARQRKAALAEYHVLLAHQEEINRQLVELISNAPWLKPERETPPAEAVEVPVEMPVQNDLVDTPQLEPLKPEKMVIPMLATSREDRMTIPLAPGVDFELIHIPAGDFWLGSEIDDPFAEADEKPQHKLHLPDYWIGATPVTYAQYDVFLRSQQTPSFEIPSGKENHPITKTTLADILAFCAWLSRKTDLTISLPNEPEWEKAARGSDALRFPWGFDEPDDRRCNFGDAVSDTTAVRTYSPLGDSPYGCSDMSGNVWELTRSRYYKSLFFGTVYRYPYLLDEEREKSSNKGVLVLRGGSFQTNATKVRCSYRRPADPLNAPIGFRVVMYPTRRS